MTREEADDDQPEPLADGMVIVVKTGGAAPSVYHSGAECGHIRKDDPLRRPKEDLPWDIPECQWCATKSKNTESDMSLYNSVVAADPEAQL
jgi:hypothetical protein